MSFQSTSGDIDLFIPSDIGAGIDIRTTSGRISTDVAITVEGTIPPYHEECPDMGHYSKILTVSTYEARQ